MKEEKKNPRKQLEKFSSIFTQLGLVLTLFIVFVSLEHETEKDLNVAIFTNHDTLETVFTFSRPVVIKKIEKKVKKVVEKQVIKTIAPPKIVKNTEKLVETLIKIPVDDKPETVVVPKKTAPTVIPSVENTMSINNVQNRPVFKGCEGLSEEENKKCFEKKIQQHVQRYFNVELAQDVGLRSGKYKIFTQFIIDKSGVISDVKIRAPHKRLEKETNKVVRKIPKFTPGKQNNTPVKVKYTLPITFNVE
ncbi:energy transducer TonB [Tenacibaculum sp. AHE15PA]|uniref:energy transducer TonB n=1 Tax=unclassified Tenacibaculum TaxID=2635139 RepID=UPI001C4FA3A2|nr:MULTISPECIES: energy transducer TonB [unclassified Tenacibaculum]QXP72980.1 energy transducer TonB [Tenacibaculum sp. AHE14PA]QXP76894.1 energy transducer TonB [Tenacibaculum sp. AHE15PA]